MKRYNAALWLLVLALAAAALWGAGFALAEGGNDLTVIPRAFPEELGTAVYDADTGTLTATAGPDSRFVAWLYIEDEADIPQTLTTLGDLGTPLQEGASFEPTASGAYTAFFDLVYSVTAETSDCGTVVLNVPDGCDPSDIAAGTRCAAIAVPRPGYELVALEIDSVQYEQGVRHEETDVIESSRLTNGRKFSFGMPAGQLTIRGQFAAKTPDYCLSYDANGGTGGMSPSFCVAGSSVWIEYNYGYIVRDGYAFTGWNTDPDGNGTAYNEGEVEIILDGDLTLYAQWEELSGWEAIRRQIEQGDTVVEINLDSNVTLEEGETGILIGAGKYVYINLSGSVLDCSRMADGWLFEVEEEAYLSLSDSSGTYRSSRNSNWDINTGRIVGLKNGIYSEGTVELYNLTLTGCTGTLIESSGEFNMTDCCVTGCGAGIVNSGRGMVMVSTIRGAQGYAVDNVGTLDISESVICDGLSDAVINREGGEMVYRGYVVNRSGAAHSQYNCGIYRNQGVGVVNSGSVYLTDSVDISENTTGIVNSSTGYCRLSTVGVFDNAGGAVGGIENTGTLEADSARIFCNTGTLVGGLRCDGDMSLRYCEVYGNTGGQTGGVEAAGAVCLDESSICCNTAQGGGTGAGGLYLRESESLDCSVFYGFYVYGNRRGGAASNVYLTAGRTITFNEMGAVNAGFTSSAPETLPLLGTGLPESANWLVLSSDQAGYRVECVSGEAGLVPVSPDDHTVTYYLDGQVYEVRAVPDGGYAGQLNIITEDYVVYDWKLDGAYYYFDEPVYSDISLYAVKETGSELSAWEKLSNRFLTGGTVRLLAGDVTAGAYDQGLVVPAGVTVELDLFGHTLDATAMSGTVIVVEEGGTLVLSDSRGDGLLKGNCSGCGVLVRGCFTQSSGRIAYCSDLAGVYVEEGGEYTLTGGAVCWNSNTRYGGVYNAGTFTFTGGEINDNGGHTLSGGVTNYGVMTMTGGRVLNNVAPLVNNVYNAGTFTMRGGSFEGGTGPRRPEVGGVDNVGRFTMTGGSMDNQSGSCSGAIRNAGQFTMTGGLLERNSSAGGQGAAIGSVGGTVSLSGGLIRYNDIWQQNDGAVHVSGGSLLLSGSPRIQGNEGPVESSDVYLAAGATIGIDGDLDAGALIGVHVENPAALPALTSGLSGHGDAGCFFANNEGYAVTDRQGEAALTYGMHEVEYIRPEGFPIHTALVEHMGFARNIQVDEPEMQVNY